MMFLLEMTYHMCWPLTPRICDCHKTAPPTYPRPSHCEAPPAPGRSGRIREESPSLCKDMPRRCSLMLLLLVSSSAQQPPANNSSSAEGNKTPLEVVVKQRPAEHAPRRNASDEELTNEVVDKGGSSVVADQGGTFEVVVERSSSKIPDDSVVTKSPSVSSVSSAPDVDVEGRLSEVGGRNLSEVAVGQSPSEAADARFSPEVPVERSPSEVGGRNLSEVGGRNLSEVGGRNLSEVAVGQSPSEAADARFSPEVPVERSPSEVGGSILPEAVIERKLSKADSGKSLPDVNVEVSRSDAARGRSLPEVSGKSPEDNRTMEDCWSDLDVDCLRRTASRRMAEMWRQDEVELTDCLVLERLEEADGEGRAVAWDEGLGLDKVSLNLEKVLASRALLLSLWGDVGVRLARSKENPGYMEVAFTLGRHADEQSGKGNKMSKMLLPLLLGFKTAGAIILAITAIKVLLVKALLVSKLALLAAVFLLLKKLLSSVGEQQHYPFLYSHYPLPYHHDYQQHTEYMPQHAYYTAPSAYAAGHYGASGAGFALSGDGDLQAHYSDNHPETAPPGDGGNSTAGARRDMPYRLPPSMLRDTGTCFLLLI
ncbi:hypothetical protein PR048_000101 [Dryococelus australis]|uniref:Uncharacterized protein n=1 Tax=Dryococelus australis TaxID=614101 RepID=A0ABQ9IDQ2_9NEOP|nr:hypothetical protein PR048_000101 [Dryococelus australis]